MQQLSCEHDMQVRHEDEMQQVSSWLLREAGAVRREQLRRCEAGAAPRSARMPECEGWGEEGGWKRGDGVYLQRPSNGTITAAHDKSGICRFVRMLCQRSLSTHTHILSLSL